MNGCHFSTKIFMALKKNILIYQTKYMLWVLEKKSLNETTLLSSKFYTHNFLLSRSMYVSRVIAPVLGRSSPSWTSI